MCLLFTANILPIENENTCISQCTVSPKESAPWKLPMYMVLYDKCLKQKLTKFPYSCILLPHCLRFINSNQIWLSLISYQDITSNVNLHAEPFLQVFCWVVDWQHTKQLQKVLKIALPSKSNVWSHNFKTMSWNETILVADDSCKIWQLHYLNKQPLKQNL